MTESKFRIIHPFHPLSGREFDIVDYLVFGKDGRIFFNNDESRLVSIPARWTSIAPIDPYVQCASGGCILRLPELLELADFLKDIREKL